MGPFETAAKPGRSGIGGEKQSYNRRGGGAMGGETNIQSTEQGSGNNRLSPKSRGRGGRGGQQGANRRAVNIVPHEEPQTSPAVKAAIDRMSKNSRCEGIPDCISEERWHTNPAYMPKYPVTEYTQEQSYETYDFDEAEAFLSNTCTPLPIFEHYKELFSVIEKHHVTVLSGETGCGKSSGLPLMLAHLYRKLGRKMRCFVAQPRRVAAIRLAERVASELGEDGIGKSVGVRISREVEDDGCPIIFATTGYLLQWFAHNDNALDEVTHLILDEVHERTVDQDLLCLLARRHLKNRLDATSHRPNFRLIIMSATLNAKGYTEYFKLPEDPVPYVGEPLKVGAKRYPVQTIFAPDLCKTFPALSEHNEWRKIGGVFQEQHSCALQMNQELDGQHDLFEEVDVTELKLLNTKHRQRLKKQCAIHSNVLQYGVHLIFNYLKGHLGPILNDESLGAVLVFLPGEAELLEMHDLLRNMSASSMGGVGGSVDGYIYHNSMMISVHILHSSVERVEVDKAFDPPERGHHKIVLATNIAESSVTIPDVKLVIDYGRRRTIEYDEMTKSLELTLGWTSRASAIQRLGRAGRVGPGACIRMYSESFFQRCLNPFDDTELSQMPLDQIILRTKNLFPSVDTVQLLNELIDPPEISRINESLQVLYRSGAITNPDTGTPWFTTFFGRTTSRLATNETTQSGMLILGASMGLAVEAVIMAAAASCQDFYSQPTALLYDNFDRDEYQTATLRSFSGRFLSDSLASEPVAAYSLLIRWVRASLNEEQPFIQRYSIIPARWRHFRGRVAQLAALLADLIEEDFLNNDGSMYQNSTGHVHDQALMQVCHEEVDKYAVPEESRRLRVLVKLMGFGGASQRSNRGGRGRFMPQNDDSLDRLELASVAFTRTDQNVNVLPSPGLLKDMRMLLFLSCAPQHEDLIQSASLSLADNEFLKFDKINVDSMLAELCQKAGCMDRYPEVQSLAKQLRGRDIPQNAPKHKKKKQTDENRALLEHALFQPEMIELRHQVMYMLNLWLGQGRAITNLDVHRHIGGIYGVDPDQLVQGILVLPNMTLDQLLFGQWGLFQWGLSRCEPGDTEASLNSSPMRQHLFESVTNGSSSPVPSSRCRSWADGYCAQGNKCQFSHGTSKIEMTDNIENTKQDDGYQTMEIVSNWTRIQYWVQLAMMSAKEEMYSKYRSTKDKEKARCLFKNNFFWTHAVSSATKGKSKAQPEEPSRKTKKAFFKEWVSLVIDDLEELYVDDSMMDLVANCYYKEIAQGICCIVERQQSLETGNVMVVVPNTKVEIMSYLRNPKHTPDIAKLFINQWGCVAFTDFTAPCEGNLREFQFDGSSYDDMDMLSEFRVNCSAYDDIEIIMKQSQAFMHDALNMVLRSEKKTVKNVTNHWLEGIMKKTVIEFRLSDFGKANPFALAYVCHFYGRQLLDVMCNVWFFFSGLKENSTIEINSTLLLEPMSNYPNLKAASRKVAVKKPDTLYEDERKSLSQTKDFRTGIQRLELYDSLLGGKEHAKHEALFGEYIPKDGPTVGFWFASDCYVSPLPFDLTRTVRVDFTSSDPYSQEPSQFTDVDLMARACAIWCPERIMTFRANGRKPKSCAYIEFPVGMNIDKVPTTFASEREINSNCLPMSFAASSFWYATSSGIPTNARIAFKLEPDKIPAHIKDDPAVDPHQKERMTTTASGTKPGFELGRLSTAAKWSYGWNKSRGKPKFYWRSVLSNLSPILVDGKLDPLPFFAVSLKNLIVSRDSGYNSVNRCATTTLVAMDGMAALAILIANPQAKNTYHGNEANHPFGVNIVDGKIYAVKNSVFHHGNDKHTWKGRGLVDEDIEVINEFRRLRSLLYVYGEGFSRNDKVINTWKQLERVASQLDDVNRSDRPPVTSSQKDLTIQYRPPRRHRDASTDKSVSDREFALSCVELYPALCVNHNTTHHSQSDIPLDKKLMIVEQFLKKSPFSHVNTDLRTNASSIDFGKTLRNLEDSVKQISRPAPKVQLLMPDRDPEVLKFTIRHLGTKPNLPTPKKTSKPKKNNKKKGPKNTGEVKQSDQANFDKPTTQPRPKNNSNKKQRQNQSVNQERHAAYEGTAAFQSGFDSKNYPSEC